jgi:hypothetical protein
MREIQVCNLCHDIADWVLPRLKQFRKVEHGYTTILYADPDSPVKNSNWIEDEEKSEAMTKFWDGILDKMIYAFETISKGDPEQDKETEEKVREGLNYFGKYLMCLWL